jgi:hypothetical protein
MIHEMKENKLKRNTERQPYPQESDPTSLSSIVGREVPPEDQAIFSSYLTRVAQIQDQYASGELVVGHTERRPEVGARVAAVVALRSLHDTAGNKRYSIPEIARALGATSSTIKFDLKRAASRDDDNGETGTTTDHQSAQSQQDMPRSLIADPYLESDVQELLKNGTLRPSQIAKELGIAPSEAKQIIDWLTAQPTQIADTREAENGTGAFSIEPPGDRDAWIQDEHNDSWSTRTDQTEVSLVVAEGSAVALFASNSYEDDRSKDSSSREIDERE